MLPPEIVDLIDDFRHTPYDICLRDTLSSAVASLDSVVIERGYIAGWFGKCYARLNDYSVDMHERLRWHVAYERMAEYLWETSNWNGHYIGNGWDHVGIMKLAGLNCVVTEPYLN